MIKVIKLKPILVVIAIILTTALLSLGIVAVVEANNSPYLPYTIVLDAGHGGRDNGCSGSSGTKESDINLSITYKLKDMLEDFGFRVVLTRMDENGLYDDNADSYKVSDMQKRIEIINKTKPDFVVSIHQNSYPDTSLCGAQAFWQEDDTFSQKLATSIQKELFSQLNNARSEANYGDYYILKESQASAVIVECGYLTNPEEEQLLSSSAYQKKVAYAIMCGITRYFELEQK